MLVRLLYASRALDTSAEAIDTILSQSRQSNPTCGITGILCYGGGIFLQAIEGGPPQGCCVAALRGDLGATFWWLDHGIGQHVQDQYLYLAEIR